MASYCTTRLAAAAALALALPQAAHATGIWLVERKPAGACTMTAVYQSDQAAPVMLSFVLDPATRDLGFVAASAGWTDLEAREGSPAALLLQFDGKTRYSRWLNESVPIAHMSGDNRAIAGQWGSENGAGLGEALAQSRNVRVTVGDTDLGDYVLDEAQASFAQLQRCAANG